MIQILKSAASSGIHFQSNSQSRSLSHEVLGMWTENGYQSGAAQPQAQWMSQQELKQVPVPMIMIYPPPPPKNLNGKVGIKLSIAAKLPSTITGISPTSVSIDPKSKTINISANIINTPNGIRQNATFNTALMLDEKALPKDYRNYTLSLWAGSVI
jgi:hypothetical protein